MQDKSLSTEELIAQDVGGRSPAGAMAGIIAGLALLWSLFQLWIASPLPFVFGFGVFNDTETRAIHLAFALLLAFLAYPAFRRSPRDRVPLADIALGLAAAACATYLFVAYEQLAQRPGNLTTLAVPFIFPENNKPGSFSDSIDSSSDINVVRDQKRLPAGQSHYHPLMPGSFLIITQQSFNGSTGRYLYI